MGRSVIGPFPGFALCRDFQPSIVASSCSAQSQGIHLCFCVSECQAAKSLSFFFWIPKRNHYKVFVKIIQTNKILLENFSLDRCSNNFVREVGYDSISFKCVIETLTNDFIAPLEVSFFVHFLDQSLVLEQFAKMHHFFESMHFLCHRSINYIV